MKEETKQIKIKREDELSKLKTRARKQAWLLKKDGFAVDFFDRYKRCWAQLDQSQIENYEIIQIHEFDGQKWNVIVKDISYKSFSHFYSLIQKYKRKYGKKNLHKHMQTIIETIR